MQKVSKQSLAMLALSILLAISIALTFTFAAVGTSKTATGTITFGGDTFIAWSGGTVDDGNTTITLTQDKFTLTQTDDGTVDATLNDIAGALTGVKVTCTNSTNAAVTFKVTVVAAETDGTVTLKAVDTKMTVSENEGTIAVGANSNVSVNLSDMLQSVVLEEITSDSPMTFQIKVEHVAA